ncbi:MAG TPA: neutral/alkaline non-lysosomal ceramidase N-terminal domain-containing protein [Solirubrobacterales bacterium]
MTARRLAPILAAVVALCFSSSATAKSPRLQAGVGRADITPPTGYAFGGWTRADRIGTGVQTRLGASVLVLRSGGRKVALVSVDLFASPGGLIAEAAKRAGHGFSQKNVLVGATHTHSGPSRFANFSTLNTLAPSIETVTDPFTYASFLQPGPPEPQLYAFLVKRIATALRRANRNLGPAAAGWGTKQLLGVTDNRSLEAHLADHGIILEPGQGTVADDPDGYAHTIDPEVSVLRVDRLDADGGRTPLGAFSTFADHGTVNNAEYLVYTQDHFGPAIRLFEAKMRRAGHVPKREPVINIFANSDEGDQTAAFDGRGPLAAERVGRAEGKAMFSAWLRAGRRLSSRPRVDLRWTRLCFCGQQTSDGRVADAPVAGIPFLTGSEENRGPLFDLTHVSLEGMRSPVTPFGEAQGHKEGIPFATTKDSYPSAVPLFVLRVADRLLITEPGEASVETGRRTRAAVLAAAKGMGIRGVTLMGLTNEFIQYLTTPEEYDRQHYEGGSTIYGPAEGAAVSDSLVELTERMRKGKPAQAPYPFDPRHGVVADGKPFGLGSALASVISQPIDVPPGAQAVFKWQGGPSGLDKRLDKRFISIQRRVGGRWRRVADDLGLSIVWTGDAAGTYDVHWQLPSRAKPGRYRFTITANLYRLRSQPFRVDRSAPATDTDPNHPAALFGPVTRR